MTLAVVARIPPSGVAAFRAYEDAVLGLVADHGGRVERRVATADGTLEVHLLRFASAEGLAAYRADPRRAAAAPLLEASGAAVEVHDVADLPVPP